MQEKMGPEREKFIKAPTPEEKARIAREWVFKSLEKTKTVDAITQEIRSIITSNAFRDLDIDTRDMCYEAIKSATTGYAHRLRENLRGDVPEIADLERSVSQAVGNVLKQ